MFTMPEKSQYRHYKIQVGGVWHNLKISPKNESELKRAINRFGDWRRCDIFYSTSCYQNSESVKGKATNPVILSNDFVLDIDHKDLEQARKNALLCYNMMSINGYEPKQLVFSGNKGYHLIYNGDLATKNWRFVGLERISPKDRPEYITKKYKSFLTYHFPRFGDFIDTEVTPDPFRVIRLPGSYNQKSQNECRIITLKELKTRLAMPSSSETSGCRQVQRANEAKSAQLNQGACVQSSLRTKPIYISNRVTGTKDRYIPIFKFPIDYDLSRAIRRMQGLGTIYRFETPKWMYYVSLMTMQPRQLEKLLRKTKCTNKHYLTLFPSDWKYKAKYYDECKVKSKGHSKLMNIYSKQDMPLGSVGKTELRVGVIPNG